MKKAVNTPTRVADIPPFGLRLQPDLKQKLEDAAKASGRSLNAEIASRLEGTFASADPYRKELADLGHDINLHDQIIGDLNEMAWAMLVRLEKVEQACGIEVDDAAPKRHRPKAKSQARPS